MRHPFYIPYLVLCLVVFFSLASSSRAEYSFLSNFEDAASQLVSDLQDNNLDFSNVSPSAQSYLIGALSNPAAMGFFESLGPLRSVCPTVIVDFPNGKQFAFRSIHERGGTDWVVNVSQSPETIESVISFGRQSSGVPAILPPVPQGVTPQPPSQIGCISPAEMRATNFQLQEACQRWPAMC